MITDDYKNGPLYIKFLYDSKQIDDQLFSFYLDTENDKSYVDIGYIDNKALRDGSMEKSGFVWINIPGTTELLFWFSRSSAIRFG